MARAYTRDKVSVCGRDRPKKEKMIGGKFEERIWEAGGKHNNQRAVMLKVTPPIGCPLTCVGVFLMERK